ncbi:MAG: hypothetical protein GTO18_11250 [Anaerolineales bacterium]|nr:hypothetical protein [Anaerolineales bacterium]
MLIVLLGASVAISACTQQPTLSAIQEPSATTLIPSTQTTTPRSDELDLRESNVINVTIESIGDGEHLFHVTLLHDDDGEAPNFADFWQVEDLEGNMFGRRILAHSHGTVPFTRSQSITIPASLSVVVVRGHDMNHGFGGQAMMVYLDSGKIKAFTEDESE